MKEIRFIIYIFLLIKLSTEEDQNYCNLNINCNNCNYCGTTNKDYCSCNFYNGFCFNETSKLHKFSSNFLLNYDGCLTNNGNWENICGKSNIILEDGETKTINFESTNEKDFLCYYNFQKKENNDKLMGITIRRKGNQTSKFDIYYIKYYNNNNNNEVRIFSDKILNERDHYDFIEYNCDKISFYLDLEDPQNFDELSLLFYYEDNRRNQGSTDIPPTSIPTIPNSTENIINILKPKSSSSSNTGLIIGLLVGGIALISGIILAVVLITKNIKRNKGNNILNNSSINSNNIDISTKKYSKYNDIKNTNTNKMDNLLKTELLPKKYHKNTVNNDEYNKCTICQEDFIDNNSIIITTKCGHTFHHTCFKNWAYNNIICPKCPNCNDLILGPESNIDLENFSIPSTMNNYTYQTGVGNTTLGLVK